MENLLFPARAALRVALETNHLRKYVTAGAVQRELWALERRARWRQGMRDLVTCFEQELDRDAAARSVPPKSAG